MLFSQKLSPVSSSLCVRSSVSAGGRSKNLGVHAGQIKEKKLLNFVIDYVLVSTWVDN